jgi:hypothetical protein
MKYPIKTSNINPNLEFYTEVVKMQKEADNYLLAFKWCLSIKESSLYLNLGEKLCIFLYEIDTSSSSGDTFFWVIVGDLPAMYLDIYGAKTTIQVLEDYASLASDWISAVESGRSTNDCYPFEAEPTKEMADLLKKRVNIIEKSIIPNVEIIELPPSLMAL